MEEGRNEGYVKILTSYKNRKARVLLLTKSDFCYTAEIVDVFADSVSFLDKFGNEILLSFDELKQVGGSRYGS